MEGRPEMRGEDGEGVEFQLWSEYQARISACCGWKTIKAKLDWKSVMESVLVSNARMFLNALSSFLPFFHRVHKTFLVSVPRFASLEKTYASCLFDSCMTSYSFSPLATKAQVGISANTPHYSPLFDPLTFMGWPRLINDELGHFIPQLWMAVLIPQPANMPEKQYFEHGEFCFYHKIRGIPVTFTPAFMLPGLIPLVAQQNSQNVAKIVWK